MLRSHHFISNNRNNYNDDTDDDNDENDGGDAALTGCLASCRGNRAAAMSVTCWPNTTRNSLPPTSSTLYKKSSPTRVDEEVAPIRESIEPGFPSASLVVTAARSLLTRPPCERCCIRNARFAEYRRASSGWIDCCIHSGDF